MGLFLLVELLRLAVLLCILVLPQEGFPLLQIVVMDDSALSVAETHSDTQHLLQRQPSINICSQLRIRFRESRAAQPTLHLLFPRQKTTYTQHFQSSQKSLIDSSDDSLLLDFRLM